MKRCGRCGEIMPLENFAWRRKNKGQRHNYCRPCHRDYHREHFLANKERYIAQAAANKGALRVERTALLLEYFESHPASTVVRRVRSCSSSTTCATSRSRSRAA